MDKIIYFLTRTSFKNHLKFVVIHKINFLYIFCHIHLKSSTNSQKSHYLLLCFWNKLIFENVIVFNITNHHSQTKPKFNAPEINVYIFLSHFLYIKSFILNIFSHSILRTQKKNISKKKFIKTTQIWHSWKAGMKIFLKGISNNNQFLSLTSNGMNCTLYILI